MYYDFDDVIARVRVAMDENRQAETLDGMGDTNTLTLDELIRKKIPEAARVVVMNAPTELVGEGEAFGDSIQWESAEGYGMGEISLPLDFLRLLTFQMSDWDCPVTEAITETHPLYIQQRSRIRGIAGNPQRPVVAIVHKPIGLVLEFYSCESGEGCCVKMARYIPTPLIDEEEDRIDIPDKLVDVVVNYTAYLTCALLGQNDTASACREVANRLMGLTKDD